MSDEQDKLKLSLEPPKLFGRKKKRAEPATPSKPAESEGTARASDAKSAKSAKATPVTETVEPAEAHTAPAPPDAADAELTALIDDVAAAEAGPVTAPEPTSGGIPDADPETVPEAVPEARTAALPPAEHESPGPARRPPTKRAARAKKAAAAAEEDEVEPALVDATELEDAEISAWLESGRGPLLTIYRAAAVTGLTVGVSLVVLTWLSLRGCEAVRGTSSCGGGPGFLLLIATFAISVLLGSALLKAFLVPDPGSSSFLAVGLVAVVALLFLIEVLDSWAMLIVIPLLGIGAYLASVWVTKTFVEPAPDA